MIKKIVILNMILSLVLSAGLYIFMNKNVAISTLATTVMLVLNLSGLFVFWRVVFLKKSIALGLLIIIFKYPLIAYCLWQMSRQDWVHPIGVFVSMLLFLLSIVGVVLYDQRRGHAF
jgi:hypothetical protein